MVVIQHENGNIKWLHIAGISTSVENITNQSQIINLKKKLKKKI